MVRHFLMIPILLFVVNGILQAHEGNALTVEVLVDGDPIREYYQGETRYIEALKGREYAIRLTNRLDIRTAVALSVDGLNTIDARHADAYGSRKWVLDPHQSIVISGWQTGLQRARRFYFTTEEDSYGKRIGQTANLGVISAVMFQEKVPWKEVSSDTPLPAESAREDSAGSPGSSNKMKDSSSTGSHAEASSGTSESKSYESAKRDKWAATGMGDRFQHRVYSVQMELDPFPVSSVSIRYEFRPVLVKMGILPPLRPMDPFMRRQQAKGFKDSEFCPDF